MTGVMTGISPKPIFFSPNLSLLYPSGHASIRGRINEDGSI